MSENLWEAFKRADALAEFKAKEDKTFEEKINMKVKEALKVDLDKVELDMVNHPSHYTFGKIEVIDYIEEKQLGYHLGNVVKYVSRAEHKGKKLEDLKKAQWFLNRYISKLESDEEI